MVNKRFTLRAACYLLGKYTLISGHLEGNETVKQAMIREAKEEAE